LNKSTDLGKGSSAALLELSGLAGIHTSYTDMWGNHHTVPEATLRAVLSAMGHSNTEDSLREFRKRPWDRLMDPVQVVIEDEQPLFIPVRFPLEHGNEDSVTLHVRFKEEGGHSEERTVHGVTPAGETEIEGTRHVRVDIPNEPNRPLGYHEVSVRVSTPHGKSKCSMRLIVTPARCHMPKARCWGIGLSLYGLRTDRNTGAGDLGDLRRLVHWSGEELGAGFVGLNPLHSIPNRLSEGISPYSPISRLFRSVLYADLSEVPLLGEDDLKGTEERIATLREAELIDYDGVADLKTGLLIRAFERFHKALESGTLPKEESDSYVSYIAREGEHLEHYSTFMALSAQLRDSSCKGRDWRCWPEEYRDPGSPEVAEFRTSHAPEVEFHKFVQWLLDRQLAKAAEAAARMPVGLYLDLAVGSSDCGSDAWANQDVIALGLHTGAPPDDFNPRGQDWLFPPMLPCRLREAGYEPFAKVIRNNLRHAGALRIDHALGLFRLFLIPEGRPPSEGTYVNFPSEDLLRIIALESVRSGTAIIAEDLGTVTEEARSGLSRHGMLSYRLLYFERDWEKGTFLPSEAYPGEALAAVNTHDLPTLRGFWEERDITLKLELDIISKREFEIAIDNRKKEKEGLLETLRPYLSNKEQSGCTYPAISMAAHAFLAETPSVLASVSLEDITNSLEQQNMPGTTTGHPNWRRKYPVSLEELVKSASNGESMLSSLMDVFTKTSRSRI
jgi:4-alpha-glucanotransferase